MTQEERTAHLEFSPSILARLGEEVNANPEHGLIELIKNSYDADALHCTVTLDATDSPGGTITVVDDGDGMDHEGITQGWLLLGRSRKDPSKKTRRGRTPAGDKGLGRLAALRLGEIAELKTRHIGSPEITRSVELRWRDFATADSVGTVPLPINIQETPDRSPGTRVRLCKLHEKLGRVVVKRLARMMLLLADPFGDDPSGFQPQLEVPAFRDLERLVKSRYFEDAEFQLTARLDDAGQISAELKDWRGQTLFLGNHEEVARPDHKTRGYRAPKARFDLWVYLLSATEFSTRRTSLGAVKEWLSHFGGVHLYQDVLRVTPYGDPGNDWLDMNLKRSRDPELRPSTNTSIGRVRIVGDQQVLVQKTDRTGFIETDAFRELREFAQDALDWMHDRRLEMRERKRSRDRQQTPIVSEKRKQKLRDAIEGLPANEKANVSQAFDRYERAHLQQVKRLTEEVQLYRTLATAGISAATLAHESEGGSLKRIAMTANLLDRRLQEDLQPATYTQRYEAHLARLKESLQGLGVLGTATLRLLEHQKRRQGKVYPYAVIREVFATYQPFLENRGIDYDLQFANGEPFLFGSEAALESIVTNLLNNSTVAFDQVQRDRRRILVRTAIDDKLLMRMVFADNGSGIQDIPLKDIWLPGKTTKRAGTGLGLTIVRDAVSDLSGRVTAEVNGELGGASFTIEVTLEGVEHA